MNRNLFPNGGWQFHQPQTGFSVPFGYTFDQTVQAIIKHRRANPAITLKFRLPTDTGAVGLELEVFTAKRLGLPDPTIPKSFARPTPLQFASHAAAELKQVAQGAAPILQWLGSGGEAVPPAEATRRAATCEACINNDVHGNWIDKFTELMSGVIRKALDKRNDLKLSTPSDERLGFCRACKCPMKLKVHTPLPIILQYLKPEVRAELAQATTRPENGPVEPLKCWILAESEPDATA